MYDSIRTIVSISVVLGCLLCVSCSDSMGMSAADGSGTGKAGSMARFAISGDTLYAIAGSEVKQFDLSEPEKPTVWSSVEVAFDIETLFPYKEYLFIGSETGIHIYEFGNLKQLEFVSELLHVQSCDPVVVEEDVAYVTLRGGSSCSVDGSNLFQIIDVSAIVHPRLVESIDMVGPMGLGVDNGEVFICDGSAGLKVLDVTDPLEIEVVAHLPEQICYDVIPDDGNLIVSSFDGLYQYDYTGSSVVELSSIKKNI